MEVIDQRQVVEALITNWLSFLRGFQSQQGGSRFYFSSDFVAGQSAESDQWLSELLLVIACARFLNKTAAFKANASGTNHYLVYNCAHELQEPIALCCNTT